MTIEDYIKNLQSMIDDAEDIGLYDEDIESLQFAIKALEQELILDKMRAEIEQEYNRLGATRADETLELGECLGLKMSLKIIDKYKAESEE